MCIIHVHSSRCRMHMHRLQQLLTKFCSCISRSQPGRPGRLLSTHLHLVLLILWSVFYCCVQAATSCWILSTDSHALLLRALDADRSEQLYSSNNIVKWQNSRQADDQTAGGKVFQTTSMHTNKTTRNGENTSACHSNSGTE